MSSSLQRKFTNSVKLTALIVVGAVVGYLASPQHSPVPPTLETTRPPSPADQAQTRPSSVATPQAAAAPARSPHRPVTEPQPADAAAIATEYLLEGRDLLAVGEWAAALEAFQMAVEIDSTAETNGVLGALHFRLASSNGAHIYLRRALEMDPENSDRWIALANVLQLRGNPGEAAQALAQARRFEPGLAIERDASGFAYRAGGSPDNVFYASRYLPSDFTRRSQQ